MKLKPWKFEMIVRKGRNALLAGWLLAGVVPFTQAADQSAATAKPQVNLKAKFVAYNRTGLSQAMASLGPSEMAGAAPGSSDSIAIIALTNILNEAQYRKVITALEMEDGTEVLTAPEVTTEIGRQARMQSVNIQTVADTTINAGPVIDIVPMIGADESTIQLGIVLNTVAFSNNGQSDNPGSSVPQVGGTITAVLPLPHFRLRQIVAHASVWDGQTIAITGLMTTNAASSTATNGVGRSLVVFVTATMVNADGTPYRTQAELEGLWLRPPPPPDSSRGRGPARVMIDDGARGAGGFGGGNK